MGMSAMSEREPVGLRPLPDNVPGGSADAMVEARVRPATRRRQVRRPFATKLSCRVVTAWTALAAAAAHPNAISNFSNPWPASATVLPGSA